MQIFGAFEYQNNRNGTDSQSHDQDYDRVSSNLSSVGSILAISSARGGTGKSALAVGLAAVLCTAGKKVAIVDADLNAPSILSMLGMKAPFQLRCADGIEPLSGPLGIRVVASDFLPEGQSPPISFIAEPETANHAPVELDYRAALRALLGGTRFGPLDFLLVDLPAGSEHLYTLSKTMAADGVLLVSHSSAHHARATRRLAEVQASMAIPIIGMVENMVGFNCDLCRSVRPLFPETEASRLARELKIPIVARIPFDPRFAESSDRGTLFMHEYPDSPLTGLLGEMARRVAALLESARSSARIGSGQVPVNREPISRDS